MLAGTIAVESERVEPGRVHQPTPFAYVALAPGPWQGEIAEELRAAGFEVALASDEVTLLWEKLVFLAPRALKTTALGAPARVAQTDPHWKLRLLH